MTNIREIPTKEAYDLPKITISSKHKAFLLSSLMVDKYNLTVNSYFTVQYDKEARLVYLRTTDKSKNKPTDMITPAKAGGTTREGRPRLLIRTPKLLKLLELTNFETFTVFPIITIKDEVKEIVFNI